MHVQVCMHGSTHLRGDAVADDLLGKKLLLALSSPTAVHYAAGQPAISRPGGGVVGGATLLCTSSLILLLSRKNMPHLTSAPWRPEHDIWLHMVGGSSIGSPVMVVLPHEEADKDAPQHVVCDGST